MALIEKITQLARQAKTASRELARLTTAEKNTCLMAMAAALERNQPQITQANALDMAVAKVSGLTAAIPSIPSGRTNSL